MSYGSIHGNTDGLIHMTRKKRRKNKTFHNENLPDRSLAWRHHVSLGWSDSVSVDDARVGEIVHLIVENYSRGSGHELIFSDVKIKT